MTCLIKASGLSRYFDERCVLSDVSLTLHPGDVLGLLGPNGAGKTSTMNILTGNLAPTKGSVVIKGIDLLDNPKRAKRYIGYLPEQPPVYRDLTVDEYLRYVAQLRGIKKAGLTEAIDKAKQRTGLDAVGKRLIDPLSKGYQQRVGIAQAIIHEPDIIILDEPTVGLDPIQIREIRALIRHLGKRHGIILSTHILPEVQTVCNRVLIMHEGKLAYNSADQEDADTRLLVLDFVSTPDFDRLGSLDSVTSVSMLGNNRIQLEWAGDNPAPAVSRLAVEQGWGLLEMTPKTPGLEQIFVSLTQGDQLRHDEVAT